MSADAGWIIAIICSLLILGGCALALARPLFRHEERLRKGFGKVRVTGATMTINGRDVSVKDIVIPNPKHRCHVSDAESYWGAHEVRKPSDDQQEARDCIDALLKDVGGK